MIYKVLERIASVSGKDTERQEKKVMDAKYSWRFLHREHCEIEKTGQCRKSIIPMVAGLLAVVLSAAACSSTSTSHVKSASSSAKGKTIAFVPGVARNSFYETMKAPAQEEASKLGMKLIWQAPSSFSVSAETPLLETILAEHPSVLIVTPDDPIAMKGPIEKFIHAGIPVITVDTTLDDTKILLSHITSDGYQGGELAAKEIASGCHDAGTTFAMGSSTNVTTLVERANGYLHEMKKYPNMKVLPVQYDNHSIANAGAITASLLTSHPHICGIFGTNNHAAEGIGPTLVRLHKTDVKLVGFDAGPTEVSLLQSGVIETLIIQRPAEEARLAVEYAYDWLVGKRRLIKHSVALPNVIATTADSHSPTITKYYYGG